MNDLTRPDIILHIDQLILDGVELAPHQREALLAAVSAELTSLFSTGGLHPGLAPGGDYPHLSADPIAQPGPAAPEHLGRQIAQSVYGSLGA